MIDPRVALVIIALCGALWAGEKAVDGTKFVAHKTKCGAMRIVGKHCAPPKPKND